MKQSSDDKTKAYSSIRVFLGLGSILCNLLLVWGLFLASWDGDSLQPIPTLSNMLWFVPLLFVILFLINFPLDFVAGYVLEKKARRFEGHFSTWLCQWLVGGLCYVALQTVGGYLFAAWLFDYAIIPVIVLLIPGILGGVRIWQFYLIPASLRQPGAWPEGYEAELKNELKKLKEPLPQDLYLYRSEDGSTLNGGRVGMGNHSRLMISDSSPQKLSPRELAILIMREERFLGWSSAQKHFHYALAWGLVGVLFSIPGVAFMALGGICAWLGLLAALTSWHAIGLVILPGIARRQILKADRQMVRADVSKREYASLLGKLQSHNRTPIHVSRASELLFYSMPSLQTRLTHLELS